MSGLKLRRPEEGWLPLALVAFIAIILGLAIDDPGWVNGKGALTNSLPGLALIGVGVGFAGPKLGLGRWTTHLVGAVLAALVIPVAAGWALHPGASIPDAFVATAAGTVNAYLDLAWRGRQFTSEEIHYVLTLGIIVWGTMQFASYAVFGHRRPLNAVIVVGLVLIANMSITSRDQLPHLMAFTAAALLLLIAMHAFDERTIWNRRRIGDPGTLANLYLRGGTVFIVVAMFGSLVLTQRAASSPLAGAWTGVNGQLIEAGETLSRLFPLGGDARSPGGVRFGASARISSQWFSDDGVAFVATVPAASPLERWRAATYDQFSLDGWEQTDVLRAPVAAGDRLLAGTPEDPVPDLTREVTVQVRPDMYRDQMVVSPGTPWSVSVGSTVLFAGEAGWFDGVEMAGNASAYDVTTRELMLGDTDLISGNRLRVASTDYPASIIERYTDVPDGAIGPDAANLLSTILQQAHPDNPVRRGRGHRELPQERQQLPLPDRRPRRQLLVLELRRMLRAHPSWLLPPLRVHDGDPAARGVPRQPDPHAAGPGLPARHAERDDRDGPRPQRPCLGGGVLPGLRLDPVRSDGRQRGPSVRDPGGSGRAQPVAGRAVG